MVDTIKILTLNPVGSSLSIIQATKVFTGWIDGTFSKLPIDQVVMSFTTRVRLGGIVQPGNFREVLEYLADDTKSLCLRQDQVVGFCAQYYEQKEFLAQGGQVTYFPFLDATDNMHVASVSWRDDGRLHIYLRKIDSGGTLHLEDVFNPRLVTLMV